jgi:hypothetical protein
MEINRQKRQGFRVAAIVCDPAQPLPEIAQQPNVHIFKSVSELKERVADLHIDSIIVSDSWYSSIYTDLYELLPLRVQFPLPRS